MVLAVMFRINSKSENYLQQGQEAQVAERLIVNQKGAGSTPVLSAEG